MLPQYTISLISALAAVGALAQGKTGERGDAIVVNNNPAGVVYQATLPDTAFDKAAFPNGGNVKGYINAVAGPSGHGVMFKVHFEGLPKDSGNFTYHLHDAPVPEDGNCTKTLAHLDPFIRGEDPVCDSAQKATCQVGDLSGKHGKVTSDPFDAKYTDDFAATVEGIGAFFGNRSFVLHYPNKTRITCANFKKVQAGTPAATETTCSNTTVKTTGGTFATMTPTQTFTTAGAASVSATVWSFGAAWLFMAIFML